MSEFWQGFAWGIGVSVVIGVVGAFVFAYLAGSKALDTIAENADDA